jgi:hypothetical protein
MLSLFAIYNNDDYNELIVIVANDHQEAFDILKRDHPDSTEAVIHKIIEFDSPHPSIVFDSNWDTNAFTLTEIESESHSAPDNIYYIKVNHATRYIAIAFSKHENAKGRNCTAYEYSEEELGHVPIN